MSFDLEVLDQKALPHFDEYYKHNDYIQNFELAAAMDTSQHRIFDTLMSCLQSLKQHNKDYLFLVNGSGDKVIKLNLEFFMTRYKSSFNLSSIKKSDLVNAVDSLNSIRVVKEGQDGSIEAISVFPRVKADPKNGVISIKIDSDYNYDSLTPINGNFTKLLHSKQVELKSVYARILYQYFISILWKRNTHVKLFELKELQRILGILDLKGKVIKKTYAKVGEFKRRCLNESIKTINDNTDIQLKLSDIKTGKTITGFKIEATKGSKINEKSNKLDTADNQLDIFRPINKKFTNLKEFIKFMKQNYKERNITNRLPGFNPKDILYINQNGYLSINRNNKIFNLSDKQDKDFSIAQELWNWLYSNLDKIGIFNEPSNLEISKYIYLNSKIIIDNKKYVINDIKDDNLEWSIIIKGDDNVTSMFKIIKQDFDLNDYLDTIKV